MKKKWIFGISSLLLSAVFLAGCGRGEKTVLAEADKAERLSYNERTDDFYEIVSASQAFSAEFAARACQNQTGENVAVSPVSVYMALALAAEASGGDTQAELLSALGVSYERLRSDFKLFYRAVAAEYKSNSGQVSARAVPVNSIWINEGLEVKTERVQALATDYFCSSFAADFAGGNKSANAAVRDYVKKQTKGLIDVDFGLDEQTLFTFINTFYLKEVWNEHGDKLPWADGEYAFTSSDGKTQAVKLMRGYYSSGRVYEGESFTSFYAGTDHGYRLRFVVPKDGFSVSDTFTGENLALISNSEIYDPYDHGNKLHYNTRCFFPEYKASYNGDVAPVLKDMGVQTMFTDECDFSPISDSPARVDKVQHVTELTVNRKGIEGAAVTVLPACGAAGPGEYEEVYRDFIVDRAFGYVLENYEGIALFAGIVNGV